MRAQHGEPEESGAQLLARILRERRARWEAKQRAKFAAQDKTPRKGWQATYSKPMPVEASGLPELPAGWAWASIEQVASDDAYSLAIGPFGSNLKVLDYRDSGVPLVFVRNIRSGRYGGAFTKHVSEEKALELRAHSVKAGDVLVTKMGEPPGDADIYPMDQPRAVITADCIKVSCCPAMMNARFLAWAINSEIGRQQIRPMTQGVAQKKISLGRFSQLAVPLASTAEQSEIVEVTSMALQDADERRRAIDHALRQSAAQRKNILQAAFSGQLVPQDPNDEPASVLLERIRAERAGRAAAKRGRRPAAVT
jgi:type I restriction enzyme, S subunit